MSENITDKDYPEPHDTCEAGGMSQYLRTKDVCVGEGMIKYSLQDKLFDAVCPEYYTEKEFENDCADHILPDDLSELRGYIARFLWADKHMRFDIPAGATSQEIARRGVYFEAIYADIGRAIADGVLANMEGK